MDSFNFEWNKNKNQSNSEKHGVSFEEAQTVFYDENAIKFMKEEYDFENMKGHKNPYASKLKQQITIKVETEILEYFQNQSKETGIPYQELIHLYLRDCVVSNRKLVLT
jgi:uncharacterized protein (DUF4415 family)